MLKQFIFKYWKQRLQLYEDRSENTADGAGVFHLRENLLKAERQFELLWLTKN